ncbi:glycosyltransferase [Fusobacterium sp.]|uniref:glycosyltransferase n=1 Tax=Fusobacterium sp. TaxID=68766 RepID=UPI002E76F90E|nr:glycosyltransferase [Fusobacterium sp.]MEE1476685.1 glycosyltransferase [Fusobacterium sp.]
MKKILVIMNNLAGGGAEKLLIKLLEKFNKNKYEITLFLLNNEGIYLRELKKFKEIKFSYLTNEINKKERIYRIRKLVHKLKKLYFCLFPNYMFNKRLGKNKYDVGIAYLEGPTTLFLSNLKNCNKKIAWVHTDLKKHRILSKYLERRAYKKVDNIVCVSNDSKISMDELYPELSKKIEVICNPIDKEEIIYKANEKRINIFNKEKLSLISIGRLVNVKGYDLLLQAHNNLIKEGMDYNLYILGEGEEREKLESYIKENNLEKNTFLLGFKENPYPFLKEADIFISSSRYEGYPLGLCEALCLEKPIIATKCTGSLEILENGKYGLLAEVDSVESIKKNIKKMILNKELRERYSVLAKEKIKTFNINKKIKEIEGKINE